MTTTDHFIHKTGRDPSATAPRDEEFPAPHPLVISPYFPERDAKNPLLDVHEGFAAAYFPTESTNRQWRDAFDRTRPHTVAAYVNVGRGLLEAGDPAGAIEILNGAVENFPEDAPAHWSLGTALFQADQVPAAIVELERAFELDALDPGIQGALAAAYWKAGVRDKARAMYERALRSRPNSSLTWQSYGYALQQMNEPAGALRALRRAIALNPRDAYSYYVAATLLAQQGRVADRFRLLAQGASLSVDVALDLITAKLQTASPAFRDPEGALEHATALSKQHPTNPRVQLHLALALALAAAPLAPTEPKAHRSALENARRLGADPATCTALAILDAARHHDRPTIDRLRPQLTAELQEPNPEHLRPILIARLKALALLPP